MNDWIEKLDGFMNLNDRDILTHAGKISHELALEKAESEYEIYNKKRILESSKEYNEFVNIIDSVGIKNKNKL